MTYNVVEMIIMQVQSNAYPLTLLFHLRNSLIAFWLKPVGLFDRHHAIREKGMGS